MVKLCNARNSNYLLNVPLDTSGRAHLGTATVVLKGAMPKRQASRPAIHAGLNRLSSFRARTSGYMCM
jgi:hypothetical protein